MLFISNDSATTLTISVLFDGSDMYMGSLDREGLRRRRHSKTACFTFLSACSTLITSIQCRRVLSRLFQHHATFPERKGVGLTTNFFNECVTYVW